MVYDAEMEGALPANKLTLNLMIVREMASELHDDKSFIGVMGGVA
jgi:hypothetical protein